MESHISQCFIRFSKLISEVVPGSVSLAFLPFVAVIVLVCLFRNAR